MSKGAVTRQRIIASLEGGMLVSRLERNDTATSNARRHLDVYIETQIRKAARSQKCSPQKSASAPPAKPRRTLIVSDETSEQVLSLSKTLLRLP